MDQLAKRYADPCFLLNGYIQTGRFDEFVENFADTVVKEEEEKRNWEFFLHKVFDSSYAEFTEQLELDKKHASMTRENLETTVQHSMNILNGFNPEQRGE